MNETLYKTLEMIPAIWLGDFLRYSLTSSLAFLLAHLVLSKKFAHRQTGRLIPRAQQIWFEFRHSLVTVFIFGLVGGGIVFMKLAGLSKIYDDTATFGYSYLLLSWIILILLHDTYFYFFHRLIHHKWFYSWSHKVHHRSVSPSPWAAESFNVVESLGHGFFLFAACLILPLHEITITLFLMFMIFFNVLGHIGYEVFPASWLKIPILKYKNTVTHHAMHHTSFNYNYGLYFTWWDRLLGTEHPHYEKKFNSTVISTEVESSSSQKTKRKIPMRFIISAIALFMITSIVLGANKSAFVYSLDKENKTLLYKLDIEFDEMNQRPTSLKWISPEGTLDTESKIKFKDGSFESYSYVRHNINESSSVHLQDEKLIFERIYQGEKSQKEFPYSQNFVTGSLAIFYLQEHWQELREQGRLSLKFGVLDMQRIIDFEAKVDSQTEEHVRVLLQPESFIVKMLVNPIEVQFSHDGSKILSISGRTLPVSHSDGKISPVEAEVDLRN